MKELFLILGMHRSGTSLTTQVMNKMTWMGDESQMVKANKWNEKGYGELEELVGINEIYFSINGLSYKSIKEIDPPNWFMKNKMIEFCDKYIENGYDKISVKDPRMSVLWSKWVLFFEKYNCCIKGIVVVRNPFEVAASLEKRDKIEKLHAINLWYYYNWNCLLFAKKYESIFVIHKLLCNNFYSQCEKIYKFVNGGKEGYNQENYYDIYEERLIHFKNEKLTLFSDVEKRAVRLYEDIEKMSQGKLALEDVIENNINEYNKVLNYGENIDYEDERRQSLTNGLLETYKYDCKNAILKYISTHKNEIVLCGNGRNTCKLLEIIEGTEIDIKYILDKQNFTTRNYKGNEINVFDYSYISSANDKEVIYIIVPAGGIADEIKKDVEDYGEVITLYEILIEYGKFEFGMR